MAKASEWVKVGSVPSESSSGSYAISVKPKPGGGLLFGCACMAWRFAKGEKSCKHVRAFLASAAAPLPMAA